MKKILGSLALLALLGISVNAPAAVLNVPGDYSTINAAVQACADGDTVMIAAGTYTDCTHDTGWPLDNPANACVIMRSNVTVIGAGMDATIVDAGAAGRCFYLFEVSNVRIENLQVTGAFAALYGAGFLVRYADDSVVIDNCKVFANTDGGIICYNEASPIISNCLITGNNAKQGGGLAMEENSAPLVMNCVIDGNEAPSAGGIVMRSGSNPTIQDCVISNNASVEDYGAGGGIGVENSAPIIHNCQIIDNTVVGFGGGVSFASGSAGEMHHCLIRGNDNSKSDGIGGGVRVSSSLPLLHHLTIVENSASGSSGVGGGLSWEFGDPAAVSNCTIADNSCGVTGVGGGIFLAWFCDVAFDYCIVSGSTSGAAVALDATFPGAGSISCSDLWGNAGGDAIVITDGGGNFSLDPEYCGVDNDNPWGITNSSPCAAGNHPAGQCNDLLIGAGPEGCGSAVADHVPSMARLLGNAPNPFNPKTDIFFVIDEAGPASIRIYDVSGRTVATLKLGHLSAGSHEATWNGMSDSGDKAASGVYLYELNTLGESHSRRMILVK